MDFMPKKITDSGSVPEFFAEAERLNRWIEQRFSSKGELAEACGLIPQGLTPYTTGVRRPASELLHKWAMLGLNVHWYLTGEGSMYAPSHHRMIYITSNDHRISLQSVIDVLNQAFTTAEKTGELAPTKEVPVKLVAIGGLMTQMEAFRQHQKKKKEKEGDKS